MLEEQFTITKDTWQNYTFRWCGEAFQAASMLPAIPVGQVVVPGQDANAVKLAAPVQPNVFYDAGAILTARQVQQQLGGPIAVMGPGNNNPIILALAQIVPDGLVQCDALKGLFSIALQELNALLQNDIKGSGDIFADVLRKISLLPTPLNLLSDIDAAEAREAIEAFKGIAEDGLEALRLEGNDKGADPDENGKVIEGDFADKILDELEKALAKSVFKIYKKLSVYFRVESLKNIDENFNCQLDDRECFDMLLSLLGKSVYWDYREDFDKGLIEKNEINNKAKFLSLTQCNWVKPLEKLEQEENEIDLLLNGDPRTGTPGLSAIIQSVQTQDSSVFDCETDFPDKNSANYKDCAVASSEYKLDLYRQFMEILENDYVFSVNDRNLNLNRLTENRRDILARYPGTVLRELRESIETRPDLDARKNWCLLNDFETEYDAGCGAEAQPILEAEIAMVARLGIIGGEEMPRLRTLEALGKLDADNDGKKNWKDYAPLNKNIPNDSNPLFKAVTGLGADLVETIGEGVRDVGNVIADGIVDASDIVRNLELDENGKLSEDSVSKEAVEELINDGLEGVKDTVGDLLTGITDDIAGP